MVPGGQGTGGDAPIPGGGAGRSGAPMPGEAADDPLLTPSEVAEMFRGNPKTVTRWAASGRISSIRTPGGHRRFRESEVRALLGGDPTPAPEPAL